MRRVGSAIAAGVAVAVLAACGGASGGGSQSQDQQTVLTGRQACTQVWGGMVVGTTPDSDASDPADIICQTLNGQLVILDGEDGELESNSNRYAYYEEADTEAGVFLAVYEAGKVTKFTAKILKPPAGYKKPAPGQYKPPTKPSNTGTVTGGSGQKSSSPSPTCTKNVNGRCK